MRIRLRRVYSPTVSPRRCYSTDPKSIVDLSYAYQDNFSIDSMEAVLAILADAESRPSQQPMRHAAQFLEAIHRRDARYLGRYVNALADDIVRYSVWKQLNSRPYLLSNQHWLANFPHSVHDIVDSLTKECCEDKKGFFVLKKDGTTVRHDLSIVRLFLLNPVDCLKYASWDAERNSRHIRFTKAYRRLGIGFPYVPCAYSYIVPDTLVLRSPPRATVYDTACLPYIPKDATTIGALLWSRMTGKHPISISDLSDVPDPVITTDHVLALMHCQEQEGKLAFTITSKRILLKIQDAKWSLREQYKQKDQDLESKPSGLLPASEHFWESSLFKQRSSASEDIWDLDKKSLESSTNPETITDPIEKVNVETVLQGVATSTGGPNRETQPIKGQSIWNVGNAEPFKVNNAPPEIPEPVAIPKHQRDYSTVNEQTIRAHVILTRARDLVDYERVAVALGQMRIPVRRPPRTVDVDHASLNDWAMLTQLMHDRVALKRFKVVVACRSRFFERLAYLSEFRWAVRQSRQHILRMIEENDDDAISTMLELHFDRYFGRLMQKSDSGILEAEAWLLNVLIGMTSGPQPFVTREMEIEAIKGFKVCVASFFIPCRKQNWGPIPKPPRVARKGLSPEEAESSESMLNAARSALNVPIKRKEPKRTTRAKSNEDGADLAEAIAVE